jgi:hypothetical protein
VWERLQVVWFEDFLVGLFLFVCGGLLHQLKFVGRLRSLRGILLELERPRRVLDMEDNRLFGYSTFIIWSSCPEEKGKNHCVEKQTRMPITRKPVHLRSGRYMCFHLHLALNYPLECIYYKNLRTFKRISNIYIFLNAIVPLSKKD